MFKVLYIVSTLKRSGPTNQLFNLIKNLDRSQFSPYLITLSPEPKDSRWTDYEEVGVKLHALNLSRIKGFFLAKRQLEEIIKSISPDLLHTQGIRPDVLSSNLGIGIPSVATIHNFPQYDYVMTYGRVKSRPMLWQHIKGMKKLNLCIGVSQAVKENLNLTFDIHNAVAVVNGVDTDSYFSVADSEKRILRKELKLNLDADIWISSGHLSERKDPVFLIKSLLKIFRGDESKHLVFIGDGPLRYECEDLVKSYSNVHVLGRVTNVADYLKASDFYISSSKAEGLPIAVLEALACGLPVLLSDIDPHREVWEMSTDIGSLFEVGNAESLQVSFDNLSKSDRTALSKAAQDLIFERLSAKMMSEKYQDIYYNLISGAVL